MKEIRAFIQPHKLNQLTRALLEIQEFTCMIVTDSKYFGRKRTENVQVSFI